MSFETLIIREDGNVAHIRLNRPERHNAFNAQMILELSRAFKIVAGLDEVRTVILSGAGRSFCAGADLDWMLSAVRMTETQNNEDALLLAEMLQTIAECSKPVIACVQGAAMGGGVGLAAAADICLVGPRATFTLPEVRLGLIPGAISPHVIAAIGARQARRWFLTAERMDAETALRIGLAHEIYESDEALDEALGEMARALSAAGPDAIEEAKALIRAMASRPVDQAAMNESATWIARMRTSAEAQEGISAFFDKRKPRWRI